MNRLKELVPSLLGWFGVWAFWLILTHNFHPTFLLALIVTSSLVMAYAGSAYINHLILLPKLRTSRRRIRYAISLLVVMLFATAIALTVIRVSYYVLWGADSDPYGVYKHFVIDLFGMAVHITLAAVVVQIAGRVRRSNTI